MFGTDVMVTVAKSFDAPIKLVFPQDLLEKGLAANNFAMLGLGDIVIPGIFIALMLRYDRRLVSRKKLHTKKMLVSTSLLSIIGSMGAKRSTYFTATFAAYVLGLLATIFVMHVFKHAQVIHTKQTPLMAFSNLLYIST